ncbi:isopeptide-forming domain-containing fimbrial protein [Bifidobacterium crudilactis]|jgi:fimbrial isopeptide formation D2 family protein|uniref:isopeptide-forming domain-containing fimbrial protein n=1 Tax=Bifidobacterium crudilactis TaxID=327277 RepID=UPI00235341F9|nr:isopeptide-forming domain-containing fimbrial protein [Bifidobacterium crudilactis]MCI2148187.1 isopeptide-forming domain-containing fimbrial protein [Bifidobacterium crudilactis]MCI2157904.1 isopeptide-forming domain-containing fimbrial protein [Bifidobacterium crudilactis]
MPGGIPAFIAFTLSMFLLLTGALGVASVEPAEADTVELGPDGYFSTLSEGATPVVTNRWDSTRRIVFGKQGAGTTGGWGTPSGGYKTLAKGEVKSVVADSVDGQSYSRSSTTSVANNEALLWADDVVTAVKFDTRVEDRNTFDNATQPYQASLALASDNRIEASPDVANKQYSVFEQGLLRAAKVEGVCTALPTDGCNDGTEPITDPVGALSDFTYRVFPLSVGDMKQYLNRTVENIGIAKDNARCANYVTYPYANKCANATNGTWLRSPRRNSNDYVYFVRYDGSVTSEPTYATVAGLRPAFRLSLDRLLLSAHSKNQSQELNAPNSGTPDSLRLTFVDADASLELSKVPFIEQDAEAGGEWVLKDLEGSSNLESQSGLGWKLVDPTDDSGEVVASGRTNYDAAAKSDGNMVVPCGTLTAGKAYTLSVWGQQDGSDTVGWSNRATKPVTGTVKANGSGECALNIKSSPSFGIELTGTTAGSLTAYRIGDYQDEVFDQTGALKSVRLDTSEGLGTVLKTAAETAGGDVDADNPIGWVAAKWLGYPTDPLSDDVTSAFSPYAGQLQLFAKELAKDTGALGAAAGSLPKLDGGPETLKVSGPGLYLIVDSSQGAGGSLPIVVGTKVFNDALGEDGSYVDFVDAGVKGKPRLGVASLKTSIADIAKRIVNDAGLDGFDVGAEVEYEIALRVPDLSGFTVFSGTYQFDVSDVAESGVTLPDAGDVRVFVGETDVTEQLPANSITVSGQTLLVTGLQSLFAGSRMTGVENLASVPAGSLIRIRYTAVLNASAVVSSPVEGESLKPNVNAVTLTRSRIGEVSNGWTDAGAGLESKAATANAYTFKLDVVKLDKDDPSKRLGGVEFEVSRAEQEGGSETLEFVGSDGVYRLAVDGEAGSATVVTKADGTLSLQGVEARGLSFKETKAPSGYFRVSDFTVDIRPVWNEDATQVTKVTYATSGTNLAYVSKDGRQMVVLDPAWSLANLPYTGGIGILILLIVGGLMLVFAVRPYVLSKRAERDANLV